MRVVRRWLILVLAVVVSVVSMIYQLSTGMNACELDRQTPPQAEQQFEEKSDRYVKVIDDESEDTGSSDVENEN